MFSWSKTVDELYPHTQQQLHAVIHMFECVVEQNEDTSVLRVQERGREDLVLKQSQLREGIVELHHH